MPAAKRELYIEQGATFRTGFTWCGILSDDDGNPILDGNGQFQPGPPIDLTGCTARMQIRERIPDAPILSATTENGRIRLGGVDGRVDIRFPATVTDLLTTEAAVYDLEIIIPDPTESEDDVERVLEGTVKISLNVTR